MASETTRRRERAKERAHAGRARRPARVLTDELSLFAYSSAEELWSEMLSRWRADESSSLVLPGALARDRFLRDLGQQTLWGARRVITLQELWLELASHLDGVPGELAAPEVEPLLASELRRFDQLLPIAEHGGGLAALAEHLEWIEKQADADYAPQTELERQIAALRRALNSRPRRLMAARRSEIARRAKEVALGRALHFAPLPEASRQLGGLLKGLARRNPVSAYILASEAVLEDWLERIAVPAERLVRRPGKRAPAAALFRGHAPVRPSELAVEWLHAEDEVRAALELAGSWIAAGTEAQRIAVLTNDVEGLAHAAAQAGREAGVPVLVRDAVQTSKTRVSALLSALAHSADPLDPPGPAGADLAELGGGEEDLKRLAAARAEGKAAELRALYELGRRLADACPAYEAARVHAWLEGLHGSVRAVIAEGIEPWSVAEIIDSAVSLRAARGDERGVILASYAEAPSLRLDGVIMTGLNAGELPRPRSRSPFTSAELLAACPALRQPDERAGFVAACAAATRRLALLTSADPEVSPSPYFAEARRAWDEQAEAAGFARLRLARVQARRAARRRSAAHPEIRAALTQAARERLPEPVPAPPRRRSYSVTELEDYLRCPYGWFVRHVLMPSTAPSPEQRTGTLVHELLAEALDCPEGERAELIARRLKEAQLAASAKRALRPRLERVLETYTGAAWPFTEHRSEHPLRVEVEDPESGAFTFSGQVDRIDLREGPGHQQLLIIDYKSNAPAYWENWRLQPYLYPVMAKQAFAAEPLGFLYVSVRDGSRRGWLVRDVPGVCGPGVSCDWHARAPKAHERALAAVAGIEAGEWSRIGQSCPPFCPHRLLSETAAEGSA